MFTLRLGYPYNIDVPTILHKYDIDDPESAINNAKRMFENSQEKKEDDDVNYGMKLTKGEGSLIISETIKEKSTFQVKVLRRNVDFSFIVSHSERTYTFRVPSNEQPTLATSVPYEVIRTVEHASG